MAVAEERGGLLWPEELEAAPRRGACEQEQLKGTRRAGSGAAL
jgi:hypothetical protein